jgi:putative DNA primase/helicase
MSVDPWKLKERLGGDVMDGGTRWLGPGPGHSRHDRSLSVRITGEGRPLVHSFSGDDFRACADYLGIDREPKRTDPPTPRRTAPPPVPDHRALAIWRDARPDGEIVAVYLRSRGITTPIPPTLRQGTALLHGRTPVPAMVAAVQGPDRRIMAVQLTYLTWEGRKAPVTRPRLATGPIRTNAVRLAAAGEVLGLAEGIETALSATQLAGVPVWATLGSENLSLARLPDQVRELHVFADADRAGQAAADKTAQRHSRRGLKVVIRTPPDGFEDWNDVAAAKARAA